MRTDNNPYLCRRGDKRDLHGGGVERKRGARRTLQSRRRRIGVIKGQRKAK